MAGFDSPLRFKLTKMVVNSHNIEFGYELLSAVPYAYELYLKGELTETISGSGSEPLYYFSPKHTINTEPRSWFNTEKARRSGLPYTFIHRYERPTLQFPPYKEHFANSEYKWQKPTLCICNRYNVEWSARPINFFDEEILDWLFKNLKKHYEIVYFAVDLPEELQDNAHSMQLDDIAICEKHDIAVFQHIKGNSWNESMLKVFANCEHYITMNGGYSIMASLFGGTNIIYSKKGDPQTKELTYNSFVRWYPNHNNQRTVEVNTYDELKAKVKAIYIDKLPTANIIVRTSKRPHSFAACMKSIAIQDYPNINVIVTTDEESGVKYTRDYKVRHIHIDKNAIELKEKPNSEEYGIQFIFNEYINIAQRLVNGFILLLDDDDMFNCNNAVSIIMKYAQKDKLAIWRTDFNDGRIIPNGNFGREIKLFDVTGIGICYHTNHVNLTDWSQWKRADYRTARNLGDKLGVIWIDAILTRLQTSPGMGKQRENYSLNRRTMKTVKMISTGKVKRIDDHLAKKVVELGEAEYIHDVVDSINKPLDIKKEVKVINPVEEKKPMEISSENKELETVEGESTQIEVKKRGRKAKA